MRIDELPSSLAARFWRSPPDSIWRTEQVLVILGRSRRWLSNRPLPVARLGPRGAALYHKRVIAAVFNEIYGQGTFDDHILDELLEDSA
ncbi:MAG: hypothetical protein R3E46_04270 [Sedimenticolaceae bacterium]